MRFCLTISEKAFVSGCLGAFSAVLHHRINHMEVMAVGITVTTETEMTISHFLIIEVDSHREEVHVVQQVVEDKIPPQSMNKAT